MKMQLEIYVKSMRKKHVQELQWKKKMWTPGIAMKVSILGGLRK